MLEILIRDGSSHQILSWKRVIAAGWAGFDLFYASFMDKVIVSTACGQTPLRARPVVDRLNGRVHIASLRDTGWAINVRGGGDLSALS